MIRIVESERGAEVDAARAIRQMILDAWPWAETAPGVDITIIPNAQCYGQTVQDIDVLLLADITDDRATFSCFKPIGREALDSDEPVAVQVRTLCLVIEVKDHAPGRVRFTGNTVKVQYRDSVEGEYWNSATEQSSDQLYSLRGYISDNVENTEPPYVTSLIWLRNVPLDSLPKCKHNVLPSRLTWTKLLNTAAAESKRIFGSRGKWFFYATHERNAGVIKKTAELFSRRLSPTPLDRGRMDKIANEAIQSDWLERIGKEQLIFEGHGGTGKTMILLGLAWRLQKDHGARVLVLTYNNALVTDLRRLLALMGRYDDSGRTLVEVQTVHSFLTRCFRQVGIMPDKDDNFYGNYQKYKRDALDLYQQQALAPDDFKKAMEANPTDLSWDYVFVDEGQDWPQDEKELLHLIFTPSRLVVADGRDQLVRQDDRCDWSLAAGYKTKRVILKKGLRMKANLARFANALARHLDLVDWAVEDNPESVGGKVIVAEGEPVSMKGLLERIVSEAKERGNHPVDLLTCVPPQLVIDGRSIASEWYGEWGYSVWDGTSERRRKTFPMSTDDLRIVQYDSCRGLEGWSVMNFDVDNLYDYKLSSWRAPSGGVPPYVDEESLAKKFAARWMMIPMTRAIDTLVLHIRSCDSFFGGIIRELHRGYRDMIEWIKI